jgi:hypothetical protein
MNKLKDIKMIGIAWIFFLFAIGFEILFSVYLRYKNGKLLRGYLGLHEDVWFFYQIIIFIIFTILIYINYKSNSLIERMFYSLINFTIAYMIYIIVTYIYIFGTSVESM